MLHATLTVGGIRQTLSADYVVRYVSCAGKHAEAGNCMPVLYWQGKRVVKPWTLTMVASQEDCSDEGNANTA